MPNKPNCPYCGTEMKGGLRRIAHIYMYFFVCKKCHAESPKVTRKGYGGPHREAEEEALKMAMQRHPEVDEIEKNIDNILDMYRLKMKSFLRGSREAEITCSYLHNELHKIIQESSIPSNRLEASATLYPLTREYTLKVKDCRTGINHDLLTFKHDIVYVEEKKNA